MSARPSSRALVALGLPGCALQLAGLVYAGWPGQQELDLLGGILVLALGTLLAVLALERHVAGLERSDRWALCAGLGPPGLYIVSTLRPAWAIPRTGGRRRTLADRGVALLLSAAVVAGFAWAGIGWSSLGTEAAAASEAGQMRANELLAHQRLGTIIEAQRQYRERDWDGDGRKTYARFHVHLWRSVRANGEPVAVGLISRKLAFAMVPGFALDGYYYKDVHTRAVLDRLQKGERKRAAAELDPAREWAVAAIPHKPRQTGSISFVALSSGAIWTRLPPTADAPVQPRWIRIRSRKHLQELQARQPRP